MRNSRISCIFFKKIYWFYGEFRYFRVSETFTDLINILKKTAFSVLKLRRWKLLQIFQHFDDLFIIVLIKKKKHSLGDSIFSYIYKRWDQTDYVTSRCRYNYRLLPISTGEKNSNILIFVWRTQNGHLVIFNFIACKRVIKAQHIFFFRFLKKCINLLLIHLFYRRFEFQVKKYSYSHEKIYFSSQHFS